MFSFSMAIAAVRSKAEPGPEHQLRVEVELGVERAFDVFGAAKTVLLAGKQQVATGNAAAAQRLDHHLRLIRRHDPVVGALEEDYRAVEARDMAERRALTIKCFLPRVRADQPV